MDNAALCRSLARALIDDPFYRAVSDAARDEEHRVELLARYMAPSLVESEAVGEVQRAGDMAAALWQLPEAGPEASGRAAKAKKATFLREVGPECLSAYEAVCAEMVARTPEALAEAWYLSILGTAPEARGQGLAAGLLARTLARADAARAVSYLETFNPLSLPFYTRMGFTEATALHEPVTGRDYWLLVRPAR
ncbi:N-acetyltransferase [Pararhodobacter sp. CCB-MM2]|uniref:GNAT family N-acetyltransferase n=1 Tax=Pararhodobacter sp. CCB-MM2 TaxID=1786003 RepID=UPI0009F35FEF|nr:GNAT family N-acetyltransferase [Pararhodobacter sp. CCB-MM2]